MTPEPQFLHVEEPLRSILAAPLLLFLILASEAATIAADEPARPARFRESVAIETNLTAQRQLELARVHLADKRWSEGIDLVRQVSANDPTSLVSVSPGRYLNVGLYAQLLLASLPPEGLSVARALVDDSAQQAFDEGVRNRDDAALRAVVRNFFVSRAAGDALLTLGQWAWESGDLTKARGYWECLLPTRTPPTPGTLAPLLRYPDARFDRAAIVARLVMCRIVQGDKQQSAEERQAFGRQFPDARGRLGDREGKLAEVLDQIAAQAQTWTFPPRDVAVTTFAVNSARNGDLPREIEVGAARWSVNLTPDPFAPGSAASFANSRLAPNLFPVVYGDVLLVNTGDQILAWNIRTGKPAWPEGHNDGPIIYSSTSDTVSSITGPQIVQRPRYTLTVSDGRLYARMGDSNSSAMRDDLRESESRLVCLDLQHGEGKLIWKIDASELDLQASFEGSPLVVEGKAYVVLRKGRTQTQTNVGCFDAKTKSRLWDRPVCAAVATVTQNDHSLAQQLLTAGDDAVFLATGTGAIAALESDGGALRWVATYESETDESWSATRDRRSLPPCLFAQNMVFAAPNDCNGILAIESHSGTRLWRRTLPGKVEHLLGVKNDVLIVSGQGLWGLEPLSGRVLWHVGFTDPASFGYGRGILAGNVVYWPTREEIFVIDQMTGALRRRIPVAVRHGELGGNLLLAGDSLIVARSQRITVFGPDAGPPPKHEPTYSKGHVAEAGTLRVADLWSLRSKWGVYDGRGDAHGEKIDLSGLWRRR